MKRIKIADLFADAPSLLGKEVCVKGWVRTHRGNKYVQFGALNDGSTIRNIQLVFDMNTFTDEQLKRPSQPRVSLWRARARARALKSR